MPKKDALPKQPQSWFKLILSSLKVYKICFLRVIWLSFIISILAFLPRTIAVMVQEPLSNLEFFSLRHSWVYITDLLALMLFIALFSRLHKVESGKPVSIMQDLKVGLRNLGSIILASILEVLLLTAITGIVVGITAFFYKHDLLFAPTVTSWALTFIIFIGQLLLLIFVSTLFIFFLPLIAIENRGVIKALERSVLLAYDHWGRIFSLQLTPWVFYVLVLFLLRFNFSINISIFHQTAITLWAVLVQSAVFSLFMLWAACLLLVQLRDLELRKHISKKEKNVI